MSRCDQVFGRRLRAHRAGRNQQYQYRLHLLRSRFAISIFH
jgi:hypothetical protein